MGLKDLMVRIRADNSELDKAVIESSRRLEQVSKRLDRMGRSLSLNVTAPILALGAGAVASSIKFEDAMAGVAKTVDASAQTITALGEEFKDLSEQIPVAATELANIGEAAGQLGIETNNILGFTRVIADLGVATNLTSEEAATDLARLANITGMPQNSFDRLGSTVVALGNNLATTEREIVSMGLRLAGAGTQVGLTEDQILALAGSLSSVGIEAESGGTALSKVMAEMAIAVGDGGEKLEQFAQIAGMSGAEFAEVFETDAADALVTFVEGLGRLSDEGVNVFQVLESVEFGNIRVRDALLRASGAGDLMRRSLDLGSTAWRENTALAIEAAKFYATTGNQLKIVWNQIRNMAAEMGDNLTPALLATVDAAKPVLEVLGNMIKGFGELPKSIQTTAIGMVTLTVVLGPALVAITRITTALGMLRGAAALGGLSAMLGPGAPIIAGLALLAGGFLLAKKGADDAAKSVADLQRQMETFSAGLADKSGEALQALERQAAAKLESLQAQMRRFASAAKAARGTSLFDNFARQLTEASKQAGIAETALRKLREEMRSRTTLPGVSGGATPLIDPDGQETQALLAKQVALAKQLQDELVAMTKTAVDDMQLEYDRLRAHILEVDEAISDDWQRVLDDRAAKIETTGLAEGFRSVFEVISGVLDDLGADARAPLEALRAQILAMEDGAERFKEELEKIDALLKGLPDVDVGFKQGLSDQAKSILDPRTIASTALGSLLSGGVSTLVSGVMSKIGGLFGPSEEQIANTEAIKKNMEAANRLADNLNALGNETVGLPFDQMLAGLQEGIGRMEFERDRIDRQENISGNKKRSQKRKVQFDESIFEQFGFTLAQVEAFAESLGMDFESLTRDADALIIALESLNTFNRDFGLLQKQFALFDIEDPGEKFASVMDLLAGQVSDGFATVLEGLTPENFDSFLEDIFADGFAGFDMSLLGEDLEFDQFLTAIGFAEGALDGLATEVERATAAIRNAPAGFKVEAARFRASDPETLADRVSDPIRLEPADPVGGGIEGGDFTRPPPITIEGDLILQGVQNPRDFLEKLEDEVEWRARTGASVIPSKNEMRL